MTITIAPPPLSFGRCELRPAERVLRVDGRAAELGARAFDLLLALVERRERIVTKHELLDLVWPGLVVEENNIAAQVSALRKVLGGGIIATIPGRGYRFTASIEGQRETPGIGGAAPPVPKLCTNLPRALPPLHGRTEDLAALGALLDQHALVSVVGAGGMGKTLLCQHLLASRHETYPHGVCWIDLAGVTDSTVLPDTVAAALGVRAAAESPLASLCAALAPLDMLVGLDNAEHLLADVAGLAAALIDAAPGLRLLVTSQAPLKLAAELVYRIGPLAVPQGPLPAARALGFSAVALFVERAHAADARFTLTDANAPAVIELCRQLDGLALAIELAAARAPTLGVQRLATSMHDRLKLLTESRNRAAPARQQTLRAALEWSHALLGARERIVFRRLAVFAGSASLEAVQEVLADTNDDAEGLDEWAVLDGLALLVERSLVATLHDDADETAPPRYRLLDSPRLYALELLCAAGEEDALRRRHAQALARHFDAMWAECHGGRLGIDAWRRQVLLDAGNAAEAMAWAMRHAQSEVAMTLVTTWLQAAPQSLHAERMALADNCHALLSQELPAPLRLRGCLSLARAWAHSRRPQAEAAAGEALMLARSLDAGTSDRWPLYRALGLTVIVAGGFGAAAPQTAALEEMQALEDPAWPPQRLRVGLEAWFFYLSRADASTAERQQRVAIGRRLAALDALAGSSAAASLSNLIDAELAAGDAAAALRSGRALLARLAGTRDDLGLAFTRLNTGAALLALDQPAQARVELQAGWRQAPRFELQPCYTDHLALLAALEGRNEAAARLAGAADARFAARGDRRQTNEAAAAASTRKLACQALGASTFARLHDEGAALDDDDIGALAFAASTPAADSR